MECKSCHKPIHGNALKALDANWHPHCFTCRTCKRPLINQQFVAFNGRPFHKRCLRCPGCKKNLKNQYVEYEGMPWHPECHRKAHRPLCDVCRKPLTRKYLVDFWGNTYCHTHTTYSNCSSCGRVVCKNITDGGMLHPDGVMICNICTLRAVDTRERAENLLNEMRLALASVGLKLNQTQTPVFLCDRDELREASRHNFHNERPILGLAQWTTTMSGGRIVARNFDRILIQNKLPEEHYRTIAIHELTHAWFFYNQYHDLPLQVEEGMCVLMEYIWLKNQDTKDAEYRRTLIEQSRDPIYGEGFQKARASLKLMPLPILMNFLKEKNKFPTRWTAFFYH